MTNTPYQQIGELFEVIGSSVRIQILLALGNGETCVCHLESLFGMRQAYISQQLIELREKGVIASRREGKFIFYHIEKTEVIDLIHQAARATGVPEIELVIRAQTRCGCPTCSREG